MGYVYVVEYNNHYKIGMTERRVEDRIKEFQLPEYPKIVKVIEVMKPSKLESILHRKLHKYRVNKEWFKFDSDDIAISLIDNILTNDSDAKDCIELSTKIVLRAKQTIVIKKSSCGQDVFIPKDVYFTANNILDLYGKKCHFYSAKTFSMYGTYIGSSGMLFKSDGDVFTTVYGTDLSECLAIEDEYKESLDIIQQFSEILAIEHHIKMERELEDKQQKERDKAAKRAIKIEQDRLLLNDIDALAVETKSKVFWKGYKTLKDVTTCDEWGTIRPILNRNPIYKDWLYGKRKRDS